MAPNFTIDYVKWSSLYDREKPFMLFIDIPPDHPDKRRTNVEFESHLTQVCDIRDCLTAFDIESHGFSFREIHEAASHNEPEDFNNRYASVVQEVLKQEFPDSDEILLTGWRCRNSEDKRNRQASSDKTYRSIDVNNPSEYLMPAENAHTDVCPLSGIQRVTQCCEKNGITRKVSRARIVNVWRPIYNPVYDWPLAICEASTVNEEDLVQVQQVYPSTISTPMFLKFNSSQRWYYARMQKPHEAWIFKQFDTAEDSDARFCPHVSFFDPDSSSDAPYRRSVEVRAVILNYE